MSVSKLYVDEIYDKSGVNKLVDLQQSIVYASQNTVVSDNYISTTGIDLQTPKVSLNNIEIFSRNNAEQKVDLSSNIKFPTGMVINVEYPTPVTNTTHYTLNDGVNYQEILDMLYYYSPIANNSKILIMWNLYLGFGNNTSQNVRLNVNGNYVLLGNGQYVSSGPSIYSTGLGSSIHAFEGKYMYQNTNNNDIRLSLFGTNSNESFYLNRAHDLDDNYRHRTPSYWTIFEIAG